MSRTHRETDVMEGAVAVPHTEFTRQDQLHLAAYNSAATIVSTNPRSAADKYLKAYKKAKAWRGRYLFLSGYTDLLIKPRTARNTIENDLAALLSIAADSQNQAVERMLAYWARGVASWDQSNRSEAARMYQKALRIYDEASVADRDILNWDCFVGNSGPGLYKQKAGKLLDFHADHCRSNLAIITGSGSFAPPTSEELSMAKSSSWPVSARTDAERAEVAVKMNNAMRVRRDECAQCGTTRSVAGDKLKVCTRCGLLWYCGAECQKLHWKARHKQQCREPKDFRAGDIVRLVKLGQQDRALQDDFFLVDGPDSSIQHGWKVLNGQKLPASGRVVCASNMQRVLTE